MGLPVPLPEYLPEGYEIKSIDVDGDIERNRWNIEIGINLVEETANTTVYPIFLDIHWFSMGIKIETDTITFNDIIAHIFRNTNHVQLVWTDREGRHVALTAVNEIGFDELVKIAESVRSPPSKVLEVSFDAVNDLRILRGDSKKLILQITNNSLKPIRVSLVRYDELPKEIQVDIEDDSFTLRPEKARDIQVEIKVGQETPSPVWPRRSFSEVAPEENAFPYPALIGEPYHHLAINCTYEIFGVISRPKRVSVDFYIDPDEILPAGMVTYQEAENAADFPLHILLPSYLPDGIDPPPVGYEIGSEEPHSITAHYKGLDVILRPEPGVTEPPDSYAGERTVIRKKTVIVGENRIDWWVYDIHNTLISDVVPMYELKLVAESMMTVGPHNNSWLGFGQ